MIYFLFVCAVIIYFCTYGVSVCLSLFLRRSIARKITNQIDSYGYKPIAGKRAKDSLFRFLFAIYRYRLRKTCKMPFIQLRMLILKKVFLLKAERNVVIHVDCIIRAPYRIEIGENSIIGQGVILDGRNGLLIGDNVNISMNAAIWTEQHDVNSCDFSCVKKSGTRIGSRVWISYNSIVLPGANVGDGAVIAANTIITKSVDPFSIMTGTAGSMKAKRNEKINYVLSDESGFIE
jgi:acetyltransferase-like isoleucine patch superfamily enzyme